MDMRAEPVARVGRSRQAPRSDCRLQNWLRPAATHWTCRSGRSIKILS